jgi:hypothetical protein
MYINVLHILKFYYILIYPLNINNILIVLMGDSHKILHDDVGGFMKMEAHLS